MHSPNYDVCLFLICIAYAAHVLEEYFFDWRSWASRISKTELQWSDFYVVNVAFFVFAFSCASIGSRYSEVSLALPALAAINGVIFHALPTLVFRRFSPGLITAFVFVCPMVVGAYASASREGLISVHSLVVSTVIGTIAMSTPVVFARINRQTIKKPNQ